MVAQPISPPCKVHNQRLVWHASPEALPRVDRLWHGNGRNDHSGRAGHRENAECDALDLAVKYYVAENLNLPADGHSVGICTIHS